MHTISVILADPAILALLAVATLALLMWVGRHSEDGRRERREYRRETRRHRRIERRSHDKQGRRYPLGLPR
jgi:hypothetical protein